MPLQLIACEVFLELLLDATYLQIAIEGVRVAHRHHAGARTLTELLGYTGFAGTPLEAESGRERRVSVRVDLWIVELIEELVESRRPARVRAFVRQAVLAYVDQMASWAPEPQGSTTPLSVDVPNGGVGEVTRIAS